MNRTSVLLPLFVVALLAISACTGAANARPIGLLPASIFGIQISIPAPAPELPAPTAIEAPAPAVESPATADTLKSVDTARATEELRQKLEATEPVITGSFCSMGE